MKTFNPSELINLPLDHPELLANLVSLLAKDYLAVRYERDVLKGQVKALVERIAHGCIAEYLETAIDIYGSSECKSALAQLGGPTK
jgi:hypothetical protein